MTFWKLMGVEPSTGMLMSWRKILPVFFCCFFLSWRARERERRELQDSTVCSHVYICFIKTKPEFFCSMLNFLGVWNVTISYFDVSVGTTSFTYTLGMMSWFRVKYLNNNQIDFFDIVMQTRTAALSMLWFFIRCHRQLKNCSVQFRTSK